VIGRLLGLVAVEEVFSYVAPVGEREQYLSRAVSAVKPYLERKGSVVPAGAPP
jgi:hypothetical protein